MVFHNLTANQIIGELRGGGGGRGAGGGGGGGAGGGVQAYHFGTNDFELGLGREGQTLPDILRVVLDPCALCSILPMWSIGAKKIGAKNQNLN